LTSSAIITPDAGERHVDCRNDAIAERSQWNAASPGRARLAQPAPGDDAGFQVGVRTTVAAPLKAMVEHRRS
jgi:hypothetical protein